MLDRFFRFRSRPGPLAGAPATPRIKTFSAQSGYVYQYYYLGYRAARRASGRGAEYVFDVSPGRGPYHPVSVFVLEKATASWEARKGRALIPAERYAIAKMALFRAFDECAPGQFGAGPTVRAADVDEILDSLGIG